MAINNIIRELTGLSLIQLSNTYRLKDSNARFLIKVNNLLKRLCPKLTYFCNLIFSCAQVSMLI